MLKCSVICYRDSFFKNFIQNNIISNLFVVCTQALKTKKPLNFFSSLLYFLFSIFYFLFSIFYSL